MEARDNDPIRPNAPKQGLPSGSDSYVEADVRRRKLVEVYESMVLSSN